MKKRAVGFFLAFAFLLSLFPRIFAPADAADPDGVWDGTTAESFASGAGTASDPYVIVNGEQLSLLAAIVNACGSSYGGYIVAVCRTAYYRLGADIILNETAGWESWGDGAAAPANVWTPVGTAANAYAETVFNGKFDGNGHSISGIYVKKNGNCAGLFGNIGPLAAISDLAAAKSYIAGNNYTGGIVGYCDRGTVLRCGFSGNIKGKNNVGGIVGYVIGGNIGFCHSAGGITGDSYVGGIAGENVNSEIGGCYNRADIKGVSAAGGISGFNHDTIGDCFNIGAVAGQNSAGGIAGVNAFNILRCYSTGEVSGAVRGGVVGILSEGTIADCYYLETAVTDPTDTHGTALGISGMRIGESFAGFDFGAVWTMGGNATYLYPELREVALTGKFASDLSLAGNGTLEVGRQIRITAEISPEDADDASVTWRVINGTGGAETDENGWVRGLSPGTVTVRAAVNDGTGIFAEKQLTVVPVIVTEITVGCGYASVLENASVQMNASVLPADAADKRVVWSVIDGTGQAFITENGLLTGVRAGTATVRATAADGSGVYGERVMTVLPESISSAEYAISGGTISKIAAGTRVSELKTKLNPCGRIKILDLYGNEMPDSAAVGTGTQAVLMNGGNAVQTLTVVATGDVNGDGVVSIGDMLAVKAHILGKSTLSGVFAKAADSSGDGVISITDFIQIKAHILGKTAIVPH